MTLTSPAFVQNGVIPSIYTCEGWNINPPLEFHGVPVEAKSLALVMDDLDAPGGIWHHWIVFNIDPSTTEIHAGMQPNGIPGSGSNESSGYVGPCPPNGKHTYRFTLYAVDKVLALPSGSTNAELLKDLEGHVITTATLEVFYSRSTS